MESIFGRHPFGNKDKEACVIKGDLIKPYIAPENDPFYSDINHLYLSTDRITVGIFSLPPGASYNPPDIHSGDEAYFILEGELTVQNPVSGQVECIKKGESMLVPAFAYHRGFNFGAGMMRTLFIIAPDVVPKNFTPEDFSGGKDAKYKSTPIFPFEQASDLPSFQPNATMQNLGGWPVDGEDARKGPLAFYKIPEDKKLAVIHGTDNPMLMKFLVSNDVFHICEIFLPSGGTRSRASEIDSHKGDSLVFVLESGMTVFLPDTRTTFEAFPGEAVFIPENVTYHILNHGASTLHALLIAAPEL
ncbi:hypothetical protein AGMMS50276_31390 [Synergistales bacterium]|nr:hypothetical protein AGMMS50276_31390 [Synergistales bacterium]